MIVIFVIRKDDPAPSGDNRYAVDVVLKGRIGKGGPPFEETLITKNGFDSSKAAIDWAKKMKFINKYSKTDDRTLD